MSARKPVRRRAARRIARYHAGLVIESVLGDGWEPDALVQKYGDEGLQEIRDQMLFIAAWLIDTGHRDGRT